MPVVAKPKKPAITELVISDIADGAQPGNVITFPATQEPHNPVNLTEDDVAEDFAHRYGQDLRFDHDRGKWFQWNGNGWTIPGSRSTSRVACVGNTAPTRSRWRPKKLQKRSSIWPGETSGSP